MSYFLQRDSTFAKKLFSVLFRGIFSQIEKKLSVPEAANVASDINTAVNNMVSSSTKFFPAFISSIQVCYFYSLLLTLVSIVIVNSGSQWKGQNCYFEFFGLVNKFFILIRHVTQFRILKPLKSCFLMHHCLHQITIYNFSMSSIGHLLPWAQTVDRPNVC